MWRVLTTLSFLFIVFSQYDKNLAFELAKLSKMAYASKHEIQTLSCYHCPKHIVKPIYFSNSKSHLQGFVAYSNLLKKIVVSIRGSVDIRNHAYNMQFSKAIYDGFQCPKCRVHQGFGSSAALLSNSILAAISELMKIYGNVEIMMTGHSLGAALSTILGLQLVIKSKYTVSIYTFGSPRVGNQQFADLCVRSFKSSYRIVNQRDIVAHILPKNFGFSHIDTQIWYKAPNKYYECLGDKVDHCSNSIQLILLTQHFMDHYLALYQPRRFQRKLKSSLTQKMPIDEEKIEKTQHFEGFHLFIILSKHQKISQIPQHAN